MTRYPENTPINKESFEASELQAALEKESCEDYSSMWQTLSKTAREAVEGGKPSEGRVLWLLADACSMTLRPTSINEPFAPSMVLDSRRSALPEDLSAEEINLLSSIYSDIDDAKLCARISDLVWIIKKPRDPQAAISAIDAYRQVPIGIDSWNGDGCKCWERAIQLCFMLRAGSGNRLQKIEQALQAALFATTANEEYLPIWISDLLGTHGLAKDVTKQICTHLEGLANAHNETGDVQLAREHYERASEWYGRSGNREKVSEMAALCAETWVNEAVARQSSDSSPSQMVAASFFENAIQKYRTIPKSYRKAHNVDSRIEELRTQLNEAGEKSLEEMGVISSDPVDITELVQNAKKAVQNKAPLDALLALSNIYQGAQVQKIRHFTKEMMNKYPLQAFFAATHMSADGRVIAKSPSTDFGGEGSEEALWAETIKHYVIELGIVVQGDIWPALETIRLEHRIPERDFVMLACHSPLIPPGREQLVGKALFAGFDNDFVTALHLLIPQLEHLVRFHLKQAGVKTTNLNQNGIENENGLSTLMEHEEVHSIFGENVAFEIRALFCDPLGPNLRNELAHGLVGFEQAQSTYSIYAWWLLLRVVFNTFWNARRRATEEANGEVGLEDSGG